jgi:hypothetical protein
MKQSTCYEVTFTTTQKITDGEDFWMYRGFRKKEDALSVARMLSTFFPYYKYPAVIEVAEYDLIEKACRNKRIIKRYRLKDENGKVVKVEDNNRPGYPKQ